MRHSTAIPVVLALSATLWAVIALRCSESPGDGVVDAGTCPIGHVFRGGTCVKEADTGDCTRNGCLKGFTCNQLTGICTPAEVDAGQGGDAEVDAASDDAEVPGDGATPEDGGEDAGVDAGEPDGGAVVCEKGKRKCDGNVAVECNASGTGWVLSADCAPYCDANKCVTGCWDGACTSRPKICQPLETHCCDYINHKVPPYSLCGQDDLLQCDPLGIEWGVKENCMTVYTKPCYIDHCRDVNQNKICTPAEQRCSLNTLMECRADGLSWYEKEKCKGCCQTTAQGSGCIEGAGTDNSVCTSDCECKSGFICVGWGITGSKVCRQKCGPVTNCPSGQSCGSGYYCTPD